MSFIYPNDFFSNTKQQLVYLFVLCFMSVLSCNTNPQQIIQENDPVFKTTDPARLYFKNTRSHQYQQITQKTSRIDHYYLKVMTKDQLIIPVIANNWLAEEAYFLFAPKEQGQENLDIKLSDSTTIQLNLQSRKSQYEAAIKLSKALSADKSCCVQTINGECLSIFASDQEKTHFNTVVRDYLKLVERF